MSLFTTSFIQVFLVSINTVFLAHRFYPGAAVAGFMISYVWVGNVRKVSIGSQADRIIYSFGAMCGGLCGLFISSMII